MVRPKPRGSKQLAAPLQTPGPCCCPRGARRPQSSLRLELISSCSCSHRSRERFNNFLAPDLRDPPKCTTEEEKQVLKIREKTGLGWANIAQKFSCAKVKGSAETGRIPAQTVKNVYNRVKTSGPRVTGVTARKPKTACKPAAAAGTKRTPAHSAAVPSLKPAAAIRKSTRRRTIVKDDDFTTGNTSSDESELSESESEE